MYKQDGLKWHVAWKSTELEQKSGAPTWTTAVFDTMEDACRFAVPKIRTDIRTHLQNPNVPSGKRHLLNELDRAMQREDWPVVKSMLADVIRYYIWVRITSVKYMVRA